jgi:pimeloyl-ACP methyl ester carboxylesterase
MQKPINEGMIAARHHLLATANTHRAMIRTARAWSANRIEREASLIRQPTLLVWGDEDNQIPLTNAFRLRDTIPNAKLIIFRSCGHIPPAEHPEKFVEAVAEFCT